MSEVMVEALREKRERLHQESLAVAKIVERDRQTLGESEKALQQAVARVDEVDAEIRKEIGG